MAKIVTSDSNIGLKELRDNVERYITAVSKGKKFTVYRHSKPVFAIVPPSEVEYDLDELDGSGWETVMKFPNKEGVTIDDFRKALAHSAHGQNPKIRS